ncbi:MAG: septation protein IspZ [Pseudomonadota bacterium]
MTDQTTAPQKLDGHEKAAVEFGPVIALFVGYFLHERIGPVLDGLFKADLFAGEDGRLFVGLALFLPAFTAAFIYSMIRTKRVAPILAVTGVLAISLGVLTFVFQDKRFFYVKPTIVYGLIAGALTLGLVTGRNFLKTIFDGALELPEDAWKTLTVRIIGFHVVAALANEVLWRTLTAGCIAGAECSGEAWWLGIKSVGFPVAYIIFIATQAPLILKHQDLEEPAD